MLLRAIFRLLSLAGLARAASYSQTSHISGSGFNSAFSYQAVPDPTNGRVNYVDAQTAARLNLTYASGNTFILRSDFTTRLSAGGAGRNSVRLQSNQQYTTAVMIFDIRHMPQGCGTWPAVWTLGTNAQWPAAGEIDIIEGVNDQASLLPLIIKYVADPPAQSPNQATLHTSAGCTVPASRAETGTPLLNNCDVVATGNSGCGVKVNDNRSYGPSFNTAGGGWYALERRNDGIKIWFWSRNGGNVPSDVSGNPSSINTDTWGTPAAYFPSTSCNIASKFGPHNIIINLTFCGDWAGQQSIYSAAGCPSTCVDYVNNNPSAFTNAFFDFASIKIYQ